MSGACENTNATNAKTTKPEPKHTLTRARRTALHPPTHLERLRIVVYPTLSTSAFRIILRSPAPISNHTAQPRALPKSNSHANKARNHNHYPSPPDCTQATRNVRDCSPLCAQESRTDRSSFVSTLKSTPPNHPNNRPRRPTDDPTTARQINDRSVQA